MCLGTRVCQPQVGRDCCVCLDCLSGRPHVSVSLLGDLFFFPSVVYLFFYLPFYLLIYPIMYVCIYLSYLSICLFINLFVCLSTYQLVSSSNYLSIHLPILTYLHIYLPIYLRLCIFISASQSICLSAFLIIFFHGSFYSRLSFYPSFISK